MSGGGSSQITPDSLAKRIEMKLPGFKISGQDLKKPTKELVVAYYTAVMEEFGVNFGPSYNLNDPTHALRLFTVVENVFVKLGLRFFSFDDIINPASKRTLQLFTVIDNFHSFADQQAREVAKLRDKRVAKLEIFQQLTGVKNTLMEQENQRAVHRATLLEQTNQLKNRIQELKAGKLALAEKQRTLREASKIIEGKLASANNCVDKLAASISQMNEELAQLDRKIVTKSLEELNQEITDLQVALKSLEDELKVQNIGLQQKVERVRSLVEEHAGLQDSNHDLEQALAQLCAERKMCATQQDVLQETKSVAATLKVKQQQLSAEEEELAKLQELHDDTKQKLNDKLQVLQDKLGNLKQELAAFMKSQKDKDVELQSIQEKIVEVSQKKEEESEASRSNQRGLEEAKEVYEEMVKHYTEQILEEMRRILKGLKML